MLNNARGTFVRRQPFAVHLLEQRLLFGGEVQTLARKRDAHAESAAPNFGKLDVCQAGLARHEFSLKI